MNYIYIFAKHSSSTVITELLKKKDIPIWYTVYVLLNDGLNKSRVSGYTQILPMQQDLYQNCTLIFFIW